ncbi:MAG: hypothetical protein HYZ53_09345 [Planctomycetes bacterium]|nr:hypothetical protein [Planctomycetota bacterium]
MRALARGASNGALSGGEALTPALSRRAGEGDRRPVGDASASSGLRGGRHIAPGSRGYSFTELLSVMAILGGLVGLLWGCFWQAWKLQLVCLARVQRAEEVADFDRLLRRHVHRAGAARVQAAAAGEGPWLVLAGPDGEVRFGRVEDRLVERRGSEGEVLETLRVRDVADAAFEVDGGAPEAAGPCRVTVRLRFVLSTERTGPRSTVELSAVSRREAGR